MFKTCLRCNKEKSIKAFNSRISSLGSKHFRPNCRGCESQLRTIESNKTKRINEAMLLELRNHACEKCSIPYDNWGFFEWHHKVPSDKKGCISNLTNRKNTKKLLEEADKCLMLCPNCHKLEHLKPGMTTGELTSSGIHKQNLEN